MDILIMRFILNFWVNLFAVSACFILFVLNFCVFKLKREYKGIHAGMFFVALLPGLNILFLAFQASLTAISWRGYKVVKQRNYVKRAQKRYAHAAKAMKATKVS